MRSISTQIVLVSLVLSVPSFLLTILDTLSQVSPLPWLRFLFLGLPLIYQCSIFVLSLLYLVFSIFVLDTSPHPIHLLNLAFNDLFYLKFIIFKPKLAFFPSQNPLLFLGSESQFTKFPETETKFVLDSVFSPYRCYQNIFTLPISTVLAQAFVIFYLNYCSSPLTCLLIYPLLPIPKVCANAIFLKITSTLPYYKII